MHTSLTQVYGTKTSNNVCLSMHACTEKYIAYLCLGIALFLFIHPLFTHKHLRRTACPEIKDCQVKGQGQSFPRRTLPGLPTTPF